MGVWHGTTHAFWGTEGTDGSIDPATLQKGNGRANVAVNFGNSKVQANMALSGGVANNHLFVFEGALDSGKLGYTARVDTTVPSGKGQITGNGTLSDVDGAIPAHVLSHDTNNVVHARGTLNGAFYGPRSAEGSTVLNAKASAETAGSWVVTDVPNVLADDKRTVVIGAFGAQLEVNSRLGQTGVLYNKDNPVTDSAAPNWKFVAD